MKHPFIANEPKVQIFSISPQLARFLLENYYGNIREESRGNIERIKSAILADTFHLNNDCICFEMFTGIILNGHHRLTAIAETGATVLVIVLCGVHKSILLDMDNGLPRNAGICIASSLGQSKEQNTLWKKRASVANMILRAARGWGLKKMPTNNDKLNYYNEHQASLDAVLKKGVNTKTNGSGFRAAMVLYFNQNPKKAQKFYDALTGNGENLFPNTAASALYFYFQNVIRGQGGESNRMRKDFNATQRAIQADIKGEKLVFGDLKNLI